MPDERRMHFQIPLNESPQQPQHTRINEKIQAPILLNTVRVVPRPPCEQCEAGESVTSNANQDPE